MDMNKLLIITRDQEDFLQEIQKLRLPDLDIYAPTSHEWILEHIQDVNIILGNPPLISQYINQAKNVVWVQSTYAGIDALNADNLQKKYTLTNVRDVYGTIISEYIFWYIFLLEKNILWNLDSQRKHIWDQKSYPSVVWKKIGIMWVGSIGRKIAEVSKVFWMQVYGYGTNSNSKDFVDTMFTQENIHEFLSDLDYLVSVLPNTPATKWIIDSQVFSALKQTALFVNVWRGANVNESDLIKAIKNKEISWAILDVFQTEPLPKDSQIWDLENVFVTPHISGYDDNNEPILEILKENYHRFSQNQELLHQIDFTKWY